MPEFSDTIIRIARTSLWTRAAKEQGGLLSGQDPSAFNPDDPIRLWIIQVGVIVLTTQLLALGLRKIRQPKVIAEVIGGILLGPTAFGRIPGFTEHIFPQESRSYLSLVANIGLCLFLFLVGLEIDSSVIKRNARMSIAVAFAGMVIPFGFGAALAVPLYNRFIDHSIQFTHFMLFTGVAYSITAFPVLCRILTELKLLDTTVGIVVLSAGVGNDIVGWTLLALSVALVNAGSGLMALWILLTCVGWTLLLLIPVKICLRWLARTTGSFETGPTMFFMTVTILILFGSAFMTDIIGVHAIFGAFLAGIIVPREGGLAIALTEKLEDMVSIIFLPLYFTLSGLSTDLGLLNDGVTWGYTIAICALAYIGKFGGCSIAARVSGFNWRESTTIGSLMSCKGLVELIVLNVGLSAGILSPRVFSMFVLEALLLTFMTTPAVLMLYPPHLRVRVAATGANFANVADGEAPDRRGEAGANEEKKDRFLVVLDRIEHLPGMMSLTQLIQPPPAYSDIGSQPNPQHGVSSSSSSHKRSSSHHGSIPFNPDLSLSALRLIEVTDRTSAVMKYSWYTTESLLHSDPILSIYRTFVELGSNGNTEVTSKVTMVNWDELAGCVKEEARRHESDMVLVPWVPSYLGADTSGEATSAPGDEPASPKATTTNPFEALFKGGASGSGATGAGSSASTHSQFVRSVFAQSTTDVALYVDQEHQIDSSPVAKTRKQHLFLPFFGGPDDRLALEFVVQLCSNNSQISATVIRIVKQEFDPTLAASGVEKPQAVHVGGEPSTFPENLLTIASGTQTQFPDTVYGNANTQTRLQSETADNVIWEKYASPPPTYEGLAPHITFKTLPTPTPLRSIVSEIIELLPTSQFRTSDRSKLLVICGRSRRLAVENHHAELRSLMEEYGTTSHGSLVRKTVGDVAASVILTKTKPSLVVIQAANI